MIENTEVKKNQPHLLGEVLASWARAGPSGKDLKRRPLTVSEARLSRRGGEAIARSTLREERYQDVPKDKL